jgi:hypothetical protein
MNGFFNRGCATMSLRTRSVAVAVSPMKGIGKPFTQFNETPILRPEVVAPFADAVGLVDATRSTPHSVRLAKARLSRRSGAT